MTFSYDNSNAEEMKAIQADSRLMRATNRPAIKLFYAAIEIERQNMFNIHEFMSHSSKHGSQINTIHYIIFFLG